MYFIEDMYFWQHIFVRKAEGFNFRKLIWGGKTLHVHTKSSNFASFQTIENITIK